MNALTADGLTRRFGDLVAVNNLTFKVPAGGVVGFVGPNGSGKTTTMGMLLGLVHATSGEAHIFGDSAFHPATLRRVERAVRAFGALVVVDTMPRRGQADAGPLLQGLHLALRTPGFLKRPSGPAAADR